MRLSHLQLHDSQLRFSALESELNKLKPLLFMQPPPLFATTSSPHKSNISQVESAMNPSPLKTKRKAAETGASREQEGNDPTATPQGHTRAEDPTTQPQADPNHPQPRSEYYRRDSRSRLLRFAPSHSRPSAQSTPGRTVFSASQTPSTHPVTPKKSKSKHKKSISHNLLPLSADARTEHLLLAARRIGRERANIVSGLMRRIEKEKEELVREREAEYLERERLQKATGVNTGSGGSVYYRQDLLDFGVNTAPTPLPVIPAMPKTPKRAPTGHTTHFLTPTLVTPRSDFHPSTSQTPNSFVFVGTPAPIPYGNSTTSTTNSSAPRSTAKPAQTPVAPPATNSQAGNHPTPLASLLSAARSMMDDESSESSTSPKPRRRAVALEHPESPLPKRRRVGNGSTSKIAPMTDFLGATPDRFRSALDVLADQAAAVFDSDQHLPIKSTSKPTLRNKGKDRRQTFSGHSPPSSPEEVGDSTPRGEPNPTRDTHSRMSTGSPVSTRSRSKVLLTERLSKEPTKALRKDGLVDVHKGSVATPRMILSPGTRRVASPLAFLTSPTPPYAGPAGDTDPPDTTLMPPDTPQVNESLERSSSSLVEDASILPRSPSTFRDNHHTIPDSPPLPSRFQPNAETSHGPSRSQIGVLATITMTSRLATIEKGPSANSALDTSENVESSLNGRDVNEESKRHGLHAVSSPSRNTPDTDADAEGEMDVDTEDDEAVIVNSSVTHETLFLATSSPQPGKSSATPGETSAKRNVGEQRTITHTES